MTMITIPTAEELTSTLAGLDRLLTAKEWERAAIVYAFTRTGEPGRPAGNDPTSGRFPVPVREFSRLGLAGLSKPDTVTMYRNRWQEAIDAGFACSVKPGDEIELPDLEWPPTRTGTDGDRRTESKVQKVTEYLSDPEVFNDDRVQAITGSRHYDSLSPEYVKKALGDPEVRREVAKDRTIIRELDETRDEVARENLAKAGLRPIPTPPEDAAAEVESIVIAEMERAQSAVRNASRALRGVALEEDGRTVLSSAANVLATLVDALQRQLTGVDMDAELSALLSRKD